MPTAGPEALKPYHWKPGQSGNPSGLAGTAALAAEIRRESGNGRELVAFMFSVMRGWGQQRRKVDGAPARGRPFLPRVAERLAAAQWLSDRGWGKSREIIELVGDATNDEARRAMLARLSEDERGQLLALLERAAGIEEDRTTVSGTDAPGSVDAELAPTEGDIQGEPAATPAPPTAPTTG